uniref:Uncharacterized protein n=1 Tax=Globodera rostochiensis TaxID=31243 RepID=A0A914GQ25_GLORO
MIFCATILILLLANAQYVEPAETADENVNDLAADAEVKELRLKVEQMAREMGQLNSQLETKNLLLENANNGKTAPEANATSIDSACQKKEHAAGLIMIIVYGTVLFGAFNLIVQHINVCFPPKQNENWNTVFVMIRYTTIVYNCFVATMSLYAFTDERFSITTIVVATSLFFVGFCVIAWTFYAVCDWKYEFGLKQQLKQIYRNFRYLAVIYFGIFGSLYRFVGIDTLLAPFIAIDRCTEGILGVMLYSRHCHPSCDMEKIIPENPTNESLKIFRHLVDRTNARYVAAIGMCTCTSASTK